MNSSLAPLVAVGCVLGSLPASPAQQDTPRAQDTSIYGADAVIRVDIQMRPEDWRALRISHRDMSGKDITTSTYQYYKADVRIDGEEFTSVGVRKKGFFGSVVSTRPSLKIRFDKWIEGQRLQGLDQLTLNNNNQDASQVHQYLAYMLFRQAGAKAPRCNFAVVKVNGENLGVYSNVESIRKPFLRRVFQTDKGKLYEGFAGDFVDDPIQFERIVEKRGKGKSGSKPVKAFRDALRDEKVSLAEIEKFVDVDAFVTTWASEVLMGHWDSYSGNRNNYYVFRDKESKRFHFIPWGADSIFRDPGPFIQQRVPKSIKAVGVVCKRLWALPEVQVRYEKEMRRILKSAWVEEQLLTEVERVENLLRPHITVPPAGFRGALGLVRSFIKSRRTGIEAELDGEAPKWNVPGFDFTEANASTPTIEIAGTFSTTMLARDPGNPATAGKATVKVVIDGEAQEPFGQFAAYAIPERQSFIRPNYPALHIMGKDPNSNEAWTLVFYIDPVRLALERPKLTVDHFGVWAVLTRGNPRSPTAKRSIFGILGDLHVDQFDAAVGGKIAGSFKVTTNFGMTQAQKEAQPGTVPKSPPRVKKG